MKKQMISTLLALALGTLTALGDEPAKVNEPTAKANEPVATATEVARPSARPKMSESKRAEMRARYERMIAERKAKTEAMLLEVVKKYIPEEDKAKALVKELQGAGLVSGRRMPRGRALPKPVQPIQPSAAKPVESAK